MLFRELNSSDKTEVHSRIAAQVQASSDVVPCVRWLLTRPLHHVETRKRLFRPASAYASSVGDRCQVDWLISQPCVRCVLRLLGMIEDSVMVCREEDLWPAVWDALCLEPSRVELPCTLCMGVCSDRLIQSLFARLQQQLTLRDQTDVPVVVVSSLTDGKAVPIPHPIRVNGWGYDARDFILSIRLCSSTFARHLAVHAWMQRSTDSLYYAESNPQGFLRRSPQDLLRRTFTTALARVHSAHPLQFPRHSAQSHFSVVVDLAPHPFSVWQGAGVRAHFLPCLSELALAHVSKSSGSGRLLQQHWRRVFPSPRKRRQGRKKRQEQSREQKPQGGAVQGGTVQGGTSQGGRTMGGQTQRDQTNDHGLPTEDSPSQSLSVYAANPHSQSFLTIMRLLHNAHALFMGDGTPLPLPLTEQELSSESAKLPLTECKLGVEGEKRVVCEKGGLPSFAENVLGYRWPLVAGEDRGSHSGDKGANDARMTSQTNSLHTKTQAEASGTGADGGDVSTEERDTKSPPAEMSTNDYGASCRSITESSGSAEQSSALDDSDSVSAQGIVEHTLASAWFPWVFDPKQSVRSSKTRSLFERLSSQLLPLARQAFKKNRDSRVPLDRVDLVDDQRAWWRAVCSRVFDRSLTNLGWSARPAASESKSDDAKKNAESFSQSSAGGDRDTSSNSRRIVAGDDTVAARLGMFPPVGMLVAAVTRPGTNAPSDRNYEGCRLLDTVWARPHRDDRHTVRGRVHSAVNLCTFSLQALRNPTYISGNYRKLSREVSHTPMNHPGRQDQMDSIENALAAVLGPVFRNYNNPRVNNFTRHTSLPRDRPDFRDDSQWRYEQAYMRYNHIFFSSGREDFDVRMMGRGRPFSCKLTNPLLTHVLCAHGSHDQEAFQELYGDTQPSAFPELLIRRETAHCERKSLSAPTDLLSGADRPVLIFSSNAALHEYVVWALQAGMEETTERGSGSVPFAVTVGARWVSGKDPQVWHYPAFSRQPQLQGGVRALLQSVSGVTLPPGGRHCAVQVARCVSFSQCMCGGVCGTEVSRRSVRSGAMALCPLLNLHVWPFSDRYSSAENKKDVDDRQQPALWEAVRACGARHRLVGFDSLGLHVSTRSVVDQMNRQVGDKCKLYRCLVFSQKPLRDGVRAVWQGMRAAAEAKHNVSTPRNVVFLLHVTQRTPLRVLHRRAVLDRPKIIVALAVRPIRSVTGARQQRGDHWFVLDVVTNAGAYVKEFVNGDRGRTRPSVSSMLGSRCRIFQLDVMGVGSPESMVRQLLLVHREAEMALQ